MLPKSLMALVGFINMTDLMLLTFTLKIELFDVPKDSNAAVVSSASYNRILSVGLVKASLGQ